jgi:DNA processing protein
MIHEKDPVAEGASGDLSWMIAHLLEMESLKRRTRLRTGANGAPETEKERLLSLVPPARKSALSSLASGLLDNAKRLGLKMIHPGSEDYPSFLRRLSMPPFCVWVQGDSDVPATLSIGMVGAREAGSRAQEGFFNLAREIVSLGWTVVSGLAKGMDGAAHRGALAGQGKTVGVVGTGLDRVYPPEHLSLAQEICARGGALLSEFSPGDGPEGWHFPHRNRMIVGLSFALVVGAHRRRSGTYITARIALEEGREIFVFDRGATGWEREGPEMLLGEGARRIDNAWDIVRALVPESSQQTSEESDCEH